MTQWKQNLGRVRDYYTSRRVVGANSSIYSIWENGEAFNDSVTPSTYVPEYRSHMVLKILSLTRDRANIFSLGCGNGFVEGDLAAQRRTVRAIDCNDEAVELTRKKGVDAFTADYFSLDPEAVTDVDAIYADGLLGHLFDPDGGLEPALRKLESLDLSSGTHLVLSNDAPRDPQAAFAPHERVEDFWFISRSYLQENLSSAGFEPVESYYFPYVRPVSGMRNRTVCIARVR
jgi:SAM-dependent methyltransferase